MSYFASYTKLLVFKFMGVLNGTRCLWSLLVYDLFKYLNG